MRVDGKAFKAVRKKIRAANPGRGESGQPAKGTQEWLAEAAIVSLRAVQYLERGEASFKTIKAVSAVLGIEHWEEYIQDYGLEYVTCTANKLVDFRPELGPNEYPESFMHSVMQMTIDPLSIHAESGKFDAFLLKEVNATLIGLRKKINFTWLAEVSITPNMQDWLGWVKEVEEMHIEANDRTISKPIMFKQTDTPQTSWHDFVEMVKASESSQFNVNVQVRFARFDKNFNIYASTDLLKILFEKGKEKYRSDWPHRAQLRTIT